MPKLEFQIRGMEPGDIPAIRALLERTEGVTLLQSETDAILVAALNRNRAGCSAATLTDGTVVGCCFGLHDGLRGSFRHVAVDSSYQRKGIGAALLAPGYQYFSTEGISRIIIQVAESSSLAQAFWQSQGFRVSSGAGGKVVSMTKDLA
jgi:ribosomal protein S18 acetylase RimI-like enzyme